MSANKKVVKEITAFFSWWKTMQFLKTAEEELQDILIKDKTKKILGNVFSVYVLNLYLFHKYIFAYA